MWLAYNCCDSKPFCIQNNLSVAYLSIWHFWNIKLFIFEICPFRKISNVLVKYEYLEHFVKKSRNRKNLINGLGKESLKVHLVLEVFAKCPVCPQAGRGVYSTVYKYKILPMWTWFMGSPNWSVCGKTLKGVIHKPCRQNFGYLWLPFPLRGLFY